MNNMIDNQVKTESLILIPIYNEQKHILNVLREIRKYSPEDLPVSMIYKDKDRTFGNYLDNPGTRLKYYQKIIDSEVKKC